MTGQPTQWAWTFRGPADTITDYLHSYLAGTPTVESINRHERRIDVNTAHIGPGAIIGAIVLFPIGLLFLLAKTRSVFQISVEEFNGGWTRVNLYGRPTSGLAQRLTQLHSGIVEEYPEADYSVAEDRERAQ